MRRATDIAIEKDGYIVLRPSHSEWMNEARCEGHKELGNTSSKCQCVFKSPR